MTDGVHSRSLPIGDPAFLSHSDIDPKLADAWRSVELTRGISEPGKELVRAFGYTLAQPAADGPGVGGPASSKEAAAKRKPDRAQPQLERCTDGTWTVGPTLSSMRETWLEVRGVRLCLCAWGPEAGPLVLCLHGILEHGAAWELVAARLAARGLRVVAPDLRGHGRSDHAGKGESYHLLDFLADIDGIARSFEKPLRLVGHSMGAALAAIYASARPQQVSGLVLVEPPSSMKPANGGMADLLAVQLDHLSKPQQHPVFSDVTAAAHRLCLATPSLPPDVARRAAERLTESCAGGVRWRWDPMLRTRAGLAFDGATLTPEIYAEMLARIAAPTTLIYGDGTHPGSEAARHEAALAMPKARRLLLSGGHHLHFEAPDELADAIAECPVTC